MADRDEGMSEGGRWDHYEKEVEELGQKIYGAILAGAGSRGGTYGEEDLRRYARYAMRSAEVYYEEFFSKEREGVAADVEGTKEGGSVG